MILENGESSLRVDMLKKIWDSVLKRILPSFCMFLRAIRDFDLYFQKMVAMAVDQVRENLEEGRLIRKILQ